MVATKRHGLAVRYACMLAFWPGLLAVSLSGCNSDEAEMAKAMDNAMRFQSLLGKTEEEVRAIFGPPEDAMGVPYPYPAVSYERIKLYEDNTPGTGLVFRDGTVWLNRKGVVVCVMPHGILQHMEGWSQETVVLMLGLPHQVIEQDSGEVLFPATMTKEEQASLFRRRSARILRYFDGTVWIGATGEVIEPPDGG